jgi:microcystin-dependent protein
MSDAFVGEVRIFAGNFAPTGWATCDGQILYISQNTALYSLLGFTYGGDGKSKFALPNLQGSVAIGVGHGPGLPSYNLGSKGGAQQVTLQLSQLAYHDHEIQCTSLDATTGTPSGNVLLARGTASDAYISSESLPSDWGWKTVALNEGVIYPQGSSEPHDNMQPYLTLLYIIALQGIMPSHA